MKIFDKVLSVIKIIFVYLFFIVICASIGGWIVGDVLYKPSQEEINNYIGPKYKNEAEMIRYERGTTGTVIGGFLAIPLTIFLRIIFSKSSKK